MRGKVKVSMAFFITIYPSFKMKKAHNIKYYELIYRIIYACQTRDGESIKKTHTLVFKCASIKLNGAITLLIFEKLYSQSCLIKSTK